MFPGCLQDFSRMFSGCSDGSYWPGGIWWSFQMKVWTLKIQRNPMIPNYSMIPAADIRWSPGIRWSPAIRWSIRSMDFDNRKVYGDTSITDGLVICHFSFFFFYLLKVVFVTFLIFFHSCAPNQIQSIGQSLQVSPVKDQVLVDPVLSNTSPHLEKLVLSLSR